MHKSRNDSGQSALGSPSGPPRWLAEIPSNLSLSVILLLSLMTHSSCNGKGVYCSLKEQYSEEERSVISFLPCNLYQPYKWSSFISANQPFVSTVIVCIGSEKKKNPQNFIGNKIYEVQYLKLAYFTKYIIFTCAGCLREMNIFRVSVSMELFSV